MASSMNKDVSIRYKGDNKDFKRAVAENNKLVKDQANKIESANAKMEGSFRGVGVAAASLVAMFATLAVTNFLKSSVKLASDFATAGGELNSSAKITLSRMEDISLEWEAIKINIGESILEGEGLYKVIDRIGKATEKIRKHGFLGALFMSKKTAEETERSDALYGVDRFGNPLPETKRRTLTELKEELRLKKEVEKADKLKAAALEKELALREKLGKEYEKLFMKVNQPKSFEEWGKAQQRDYGGLAAGPEVSINKVTSAMEAQANMIQSLSNVFQDMFMNIDKGFKGMIQSLIGGIKQLVTELIAKAAVLMLIRTLFPMSAGVDATTELMNMFGPKAFSGGTKVMGGIGSQNISLSGGFKLQGKDAYLLVERRANLLMGNT